MFKFHTFIGLCYLNSLNISISSLITHIMNQTQKTDLQDLQNRLRCERLLKSNKLDTTGHNMLIYSKKISDLLEAF
jgi:hypothetical protein